jgi:predicted  nucleic acid-binding Zn-ribbon protein
MMLSNTLGFVVLQDCLEDANYAVEVGDVQRARACLKTARQNLRSLVMELMTAKGRIEELEAQLGEVMDGYSQVAEEDHAEPAELISP